MAAVSALRGAEPRQLLSGSLQANLRLNPP